MDSSQRHLPNENLPDAESSPDHRLQESCDRIVDCCRQGGDDSSLRELIQEVPTAFRERLLQKLEGLDAQGLSQLARARLDSWARFLATESTVRSSAGQEAMRATSEFAKPRGMPAQVGRYEIKEWLGGGGFGDVYRAHDPKLQKDVALKIPKIRWRQSGGSTAGLLAEARYAAQLEHPHILPTLDVQHEHDPPFLVMKYIQGQPLNAWLSDRRPSIAEIVRLLIKIGEAVGVAHRQEVIHRDLKPGNILVDSEDHPYVCDFGLAIRVASRADVEQVAAAGTLPYMAPEQARGESHRLDRRTDIWSLGVILYESLTGCRPFAGAKECDELTNILHADPPRPRMLQPSIPPELERICLRCLCKRRSDRYGTTADLVDDLRCWLDCCPAPTSGPEPSARSSDAPLHIVPKGLRSFDEDDQDFFLELLPGPRDRHGLPESIRFWKTRIEETNPHKTFAVGLIYGPSGCGKSSLVRAGLLPRLAPHVRPVYVEATAHDTDARIVAGLRHRCRDLPAQGSLVDLCEQLRQRVTGGGGKVLIVIDQFEQWLHSAASDDDSQLVDAVRQCDGEHLQALLLVRDDFWMAVSRFMEQIEIPMVEGENSSKVGLFDERHARRVLQLLGRAYGRWPDARTKLTRDQQRFLNQSIAELAEDGQLVCVRLALFADMMQGRPWTLAELREIGGMGGVQGVGVAFLDESFSVKTAPKSYTAHKSAITRILAELLPATGTDIRGCLRSYEELAMAADYLHRPRDFQTVMGILEKQLRLISPTDRVGLADPARSNPPTVASTVEDPARSSRTNSDVTIQPDSNYYQLTHDYLVPSLRAWLTREKKQTAPGRAELLLEERAARWKEKRENQQLPNLFEYARIVRHVGRTHRNEFEHEMMRRATRYYGVWGVILMALVLAATLGGREASARIKVAALIQGLLNASPDNVRGSVEALQPYLPRAREILREYAAIDSQNEEQRRAQLHVRLALVAKDETHVGGLLESLLTVPSPSYITIISDILRPYKDRVAAALWQELHHATAAAKRRFHAGLVLVRYEPDSPLWADEDRRFLVEQLVAANRDQQPFYLQCLAGAATEYLAHFEHLFRTSPSPEIQTAAARALGVCAGHDSQRLARLLTVASPDQFAILFPYLANAADVQLEPVKTHLTEQAAQLPADDSGSMERVAFGERRAGAAITLSRLGERERVLPALDLRDDPEALTQFVHGAIPRGLQAEQVLALLQLAVGQLAEEKARWRPTENERQKGIFAEGCPDASVSPPNRARYALLLILGQFSLQDLSRTDRVAILGDLDHWYAHDPSSSIHGACAWVLRRWGQNDILQRVEERALDYSPDREWYTLVLRRPPARDATDSRLAAVNMTFVVFPPGTYEIGSVLVEERGATLEAHRATITRSFAVLDRETTWAMYDAFDARRRSGWEGQQQRELTPDMPAAYVSKIDVAGYCRWLTSQMGLGESDQCYGELIPIEKADEGFPHNWPMDPARRGFRLLTEKEWEIACRSGSRYAWSFGCDASRLGNYAWFGDDFAAPRVCGQLQPNLRGLFDMHGNVWEWCYDLYDDYPTASLTGPDKGLGHTIRGGSCRSSATQCRSAFRYAQGDQQADEIGFRIAQTLPSAAGLAGVEAIMDLAPTAPLRNH